MPTGPQGQKRPADAIGLAVLVARIATGEENEEPAYGSSSKPGSGGGKARAAKLSPDRRHEIATAASAARWKERRVG